jgi:hypothetical protein
MIGQATFLRKPPGAKTPAVFLFAFLLQLLAFGFRIEVQSSTKPAM